VNPDDIELVLTDAPSDEMSEVLGGRLSAFNIERLGPSNRRPLCIAIRSRPDGRLLGGLCGRTGFRRLFVELLFVPEALSGRGLGGTLLQKAEQRPKRATASAPGSIHSVPRPSVSTSATATGCSAKSPTIHPATRASFSPRTSRPPGSRRRRR
jgi:hypothetical protein